MSIWVVHAVQVLCDVIEVSVVRGESGGCEICMCFLSGVGGMGVSG